jgi:chitinase
MAALPGKVFGTYWTNWDSLPLAKVHPAYNTIWLAFATPNGGGAVQWSQSAETPAQFKADLQAFRSAGKCVILSAGGAGSYINLKTSTRAGQFIASVEEIYAQLGGFDGIDFDIEGGTLYPVQLAAIAKALKSRYGRQFAVTVPPAPWSSPFRQACEVLNAAGVLDLASPQFYDLEGLADDASKISNLLSEIEGKWLPAMGGDASKLAIGYGIGSTVSETMTPPAFGSAWGTLVKAYPTLRGAFCWDATADAEQNWEFATTFGPVIG